MEAGGHGGGRDGDRLMNKKGALDPFILNS